MKRLFTLLVVLGFVAAQAYGQRLVITINSPEDLAGPIEEIGRTDVDEPWDTQPEVGDNITADVVLVDDGSDFPSLGCEPSEPGQYDGNIVLIRRGECAFIEKAFQAQEAGALAVFIANNVAGEGAMGMLGDGRMLDIPVYSVSFETGEAIIDALEDGPVNMSIEVVVSSVDVSITDVRNPILFIQPWSTPQAINALTGIGGEGGNSLGARIENVGTDPIAGDLVFTVRSGDDEIASNSVPFSLEGGEAVVIVDDPLFSVNFNDPLEVGLYTYEYLITGDELNEQDADLSDNSVVKSFEINDGSFYQSSADITSWTRPFPRPDNFEDLVYAAGVYFPFFENEEDYTIESIEVSLAGVEIGPGGGPAGNAAILDGLELNVTMLKITDGSNVFAGGGTYDTEEIVGFGDYITSTDDHFSTVEIPLEGFLTEEVEVDPDFFYCPMIEFPNGRVWLGTDFDDYTRDAGLGENTVYLFPDAYFWEGQFQQAITSGVMWMKLNLRSGSVSTKPELPEAAIALMPNPASDYSMLDLKFDNPTNATITLTDMNGRVLNIYRQENITEHTQQIDVSRLASGTYFVRVATPDAHSVRKLSVVK